MSSKSWGSIVIASARARARLQPRDEVVEARLTGETVAFPCKRMLRVLVADDSLDAADSLSMLMRYWGHDVRVAYSGAAVLEITSTYRPDVLLLDIAMPRMDGFVLARHLRRQPALEDALLVAITGYADDAHRLQGAEAGFDLYLNKPVDPAILEELLQLEWDRLVEEPELPAAPLRPDAILVVDDTSIGARELQHELD